MSNEVFFVVVSIGVVALVLFMAFAGPDRGKPPPASVDSPPASSPGDETASTSTTDTKKAAPERASGENWRVWGWILAVGGAIGLGFALFMPIAVETDVPSILGGGTSNVVNLGLIFHKGVAIAGSLSAMVLGIFCAAVSAIIGALGERR